MAEKYLFHFKSNELSNHPSMSTYIFDVDIFINCVQQTSSTLKKYCNYTLHCHTFSKGEFLNWFASYK